MDHEIQQAASQLEAQPSSAANPTKEADAAAESPRRPDIQRRLERVSAYGAAALSKRNALLANVGAINSGLMTVNLYLEQSLVQALATGPPSDERLEKLRPSIDMYLRVTRQIDRFAQLEIKSKPRRSLQIDAAQGGNGLKPNGTVS
jgi:hypothetical protein